MPTDHSAKIKALELKIAMLSDEARNMSPGHLKGDKLRQIKRLNRKRKLLIREMEKGEKEQ